MRHTRIGEMMLLSGVGLHLGTDEGMYFVLVVRVVASKELSSIKDRRRERLWGS